MSGDSESERSVYRPSGKVNWLRLPFWTLATLLVSLGMAWCLYLIFEWGWYYFIIVPFLVSLPVLGAVCLAVHASRCRSRFVAAMLGVVAAVVFYLGYFHIHMVSLFGPQLVSRVDLLPQFVQVRMELDQVVDERGKKSVRGPIHNWVHFGIELLGLTVMMGIVAAGRARRAYCESCGCWTRKQTVYGPPGCGFAVHDALRQGAWEGLTKVPALAANPSESRSVFDLEYCPAAVKDRCRTPAFLSIRELEVTGKGKSGGTKTNELLKQAELSAEELQALSQKIPAIQLPTTMCLAEAAAAPDQAVGVRSPAGVVVESLPEGPAARAHTNAFLMTNLALSLAPIVAVVVGIVLIVLGVRSNPLSADDPLAAWVLLVLGVVLALAGVTVCWRFLDFFTVRYVYRLIRNEIQLRGDAIVDPNDPEAVYVKIVPRENWTTVTPDNAVDGGLLKADPRSGQLLFEGARQRYRIPAHLITSCQVEAINPSAGPGVIYTTVVQIAAPPTGQSSEQAAHWEVPFLPRPTTLVKYRKDLRQQMAEDLNRRIHAILRPS